MLPDPQHPPTPAPQRPGYQPVPRDVRVRPTFDARTPDCSSVGCHAADKFRRQTYAANFGETPLGDIHSVPVADIPKFDILCGGFPCQPFSLAGVSKKNNLGSLHGFQDVKQGNLLFSIADILDHHQPSAFVLENVKHLVLHDEGRTFKIIHDTLTGALGYQVHWKIIDAQSVVPHHRQRGFPGNSRQSGDAKFGEVIESGIVERG